MPALRNYGSSKQGVQQRTPLPKEGEEIPLLRPPRGTEEGKKGGGSKGGPTPGQQKAWKNLRMSIERRYWDVLTEAQQKEFKGMQDKDRQKWWNIKRS